MINPLLFIALMISSVATSQGALPPEEKATSSQALESPSTRAASHLTGNIQVRGRELLVDGKPFVIKAVCYSPVPKGKTFPEGLLFLTPTKADLATIEKDFQLMSAAGVNTVRTYIPMTDPRVLDLLVKYHLRTIVPVFNDISYTPFSTIPSTVSTLKNHPSTLIWEIGNEWNYNKFDLKGTNAQNAASQEPKAAPTPELKTVVKPTSLELLAKAIATVRAGDTTHPISTVIGDMPKEESFWKSIPDAQIDLYGSNIYDGRTFGDRFKRWSTISTKPLYIGEFGASAFNIAKKGEDGAAQAFGLKALLTEIQNNLSSKHSNGVVIGGAAFEWNDEWWKSGGLPTVHGSDGFYLVMGDNGIPKLRIYPQDEAADAALPKISGPYPDHIFHEKWWGLVDINRHKRPAYGVLKEFYSK